MQPPADGHSGFFCFHEPHVSLLNKDFEGKTLSTMLSGFGDGQLQVLLDEPPAGRSVAGLGLAAQLYPLPVARLCLCAP